MLDSFVTLVHWLTWPNAQPPLSKSSAPRKHSSRQSRPATTHPNTVSFIRHSWSTPPHPRIRVRSQEPLPLNAPSARDAMLWANPNRLILVNNPRLILRRGFNISRPTKDLRRLRSRLLERHLGIIRSNIRRRDSSLRGNLSSRRMGIMGRGRNSTDDCLSVHMNSILTSIFVLFRYIQ